MKRLFLLLNVYRKELFGINRRAHMPGRKLSAGVFYALIVLAALGILALVSVYCAGLAYGLNLVGLLDLYPRLIFAVLCLMALVTTIARASDVLVRTRDYDITASLPIPTWALAAARVLRLYVINLVFTLMIALPAMACYAFFARPVWTFYVYYILGMLISPLAPVVISALIGMAVALISSQFVGARYVKLALGFLATVAVVIGSTMFGFVFQTSEALVQMVTNISGLINRIWPLTDLFARSCLKGDIQAFALLALISLGVFVLFSLLFGRFFVKLTTQADAKRTRNRAVAVKGQRSVRSALFQRELKRYLGCSIYVMNTAMGLVLSLVGVGALCVVGLDKLLMVMELSGASKYALPLLPYILMVLIGMSTTTGSAVSLEGKALWIVRSIPVTAYDWLMAKVHLSVAVAAPFAALDALILIIAFKPDPLTGASMLLLPLVFSLLNALIGLFANIRFHRFDWMNETVIVKQSLSAMFPVLSAMLLPVLPAVLSVTGGRSGQVALLTLLTMIALSAALLALLRAKAESIARRIN